MTPTPSVEVPNLTFEELIDQVVSHLKGEELEVTTGIAPEHKVQMWEQLFQGNVIPMIQDTQKKQNEILGFQLAMSFLRNLKTEHKATPLQLALSQKNNKVYVWAVIEDEDQKTMDAIMYSVIDANYSNRDSGLSISPMIVERSEDHPIPSQYKLIPINA